MKNYWITWIGELPPLKSEIAFIINIINLSEQEDSKSEKAPTELLKLDGVASMDVLQSSANWTVAWWLDKFLYLYIYLSSMKLDEKA